MDEGEINTNEAHQWWDGHYEAIGTRISATLGIGKAWNITGDELDSLFTMCAFEGMTSPFF